MTHGVGRAPSDSGLSVKMIEEKLTQLQASRGGVWRDGLARFLGPELCERLHILTVPGPGRPDVDGADDVRAKVIWRLRELVRSLGREEHRQSAEIAFNITQHRELRDMQTIGERVNWGRERGLCKARRTVGKHVAKEVIPEFARELSKRQPVPPRGELDTILAEFREGTHAVDQPETLPTDPERPHLVPDVAEAGGHSFAEAAAPSKSARIAGGLQGRKLPRVAGERSDPTQEPRPELVVRSSEHRGNSATITMARLGAAVNRHWVPSALVVVFLLSIASAQVLPPYSKGFAATVDYLLGDGLIGVGLPSALALGLLGELLVVLSLHKRLNAAIVAAFMAIALTYIIGHWYGYYKDTEFARELQRDVNEGTTVYVSEFDSYGPCPEYQIPNERPYPFTSCGIADGVLRAQVDARYQRVAIHPASNSSFATGYIPPPGDYFQSTTHYIETRFRVLNQGPIRSCGITLESTGAIHLFRVQHAVVNGERGYTAEIARVPDPSETSEVLLPETEDGSPWLGHGVEAIATSDVLPPHVERSSIPGLDNDEWTKLGLLVTGRFRTVLVNDRVAMRFEHDQQEVEVPRAPLTNIARASVAVMSGSERSGGSATCEFDYLRVSSIPD